MAQIGIQEKQRSMWPWVLLALAAALILWWFLSQRNESRTASQVSGGIVAPAASTDTTAAMEAGARSAAVTEFVLHAERNANGTMGTDHRYTAEGLRKLAAALEEINAGATATAAGGGELSSQLAILRQQADSLERAPQSTEHARLAREGMTTGARALQMVQQQRAPNAADHVSRANQSAQAVQPGPKLLEQRQPVKEFFDHAAAAVRAIAEHRGT